MSEGLIFRVICEMVKKAMCSVDAICYLFRLNEDIGYSQGTEESGLVVPKAFKIK